AVLCKVNTGAEVKKIYVKNGDYVNEGDPICELDNQKQIDAAFITYDTAKRAYERVKVLYERGDISKQSYEQTKAQYDGAKLSYDTQVEFATPVATGDGYIENTKINDKASLISSNTGLFNVKATITDNENLAQGIMAKVTAIYDESLDTMIIPRNVVYYENEKPLVYCLDKDSKVHMVFLTLGIETDDEVEVLDGIDMNTKIISTWNSDLVEGTLVKGIDTSRYEVIKKSGRKNNAKKKAIDNTIETATETKEIEEPTEEEAISEVAVEEATASDITVVEATVVEAIVVEATVVEENEEENTVLEETTSEATMIESEEKIEQETPAVGIR
ncbi:MAG: biotin/lipoyl-binding protein, partial [Lachnospiraceae bacterium]|nr:biotin/lipoyl-binding protein [Lachnospiraceae bacterium]